MSVMIHIYGDTDEADRFAAYLVNTISRNYYILSGGLDRLEKLDDRGYNFSAEEVPDFPYFLFEDTKRIADKLSFSCGGEEGI